METTARKSVAPFYAVAVLWLVWGALFPLYAATHYVLLAAASAGVFFAVNALCRSGGAIGGTEETAKKQMPSPKKRPPETRRWTRCSRTGAWPSPR